MLGLLTLIKAFTFLFSLAGWGWISSYIIYNNSQLRFFYSAGLGLLVLSILGGILNFLNLANERYLVFVIFCGLFLFIICLLRSNAYGIKILTKNNWPSLIFLSLLSIIIFIVMGFIFYRSIIASFSEKILQAGSLGEDPFSEKRIVSGFGAIYFLNATVKAWFGNYYYLSFIDPALPVVIFLGIIHEKINAIFKNNISAIIFSILIAFAFSTEWTLGRTVAANVLLSMSFLLLLITLEESKPGLDDLRRFVMLGIILAGSIALKTNVILIFPIIVLSYLFIDAHFAKISFNYSFLAALSAIVIIASATWGISSFISNGTYLFPFLGSGNHISSYLPSEKIYVGILSPYIDSVVKHFFSERITWLALISILILTLQNLKKIEKIKLVVLIITPLCV